MFTLIKPDTRIDFVGNRHVAYAISGVVVLVSLLAIAIWGPRLGIDFSGGSLLHVRFQRPVAIGEVRGALRELGSDVSVQDFGATEGEFLLRIPEAGSGFGEVGARIKAALDQAFGAATYEVLRTETVGPRVGKDLRQKGILAILFATLMMGAYIALRFELRFGIGAAIALSHDVLAAVGALILFNYEFDLTVVAALLTVVGFSVNDTVIVSDRIRENMRKLRRQPLDAIINVSVNETLSRTILTTGTTLLVTITLYLLGGSVIHAFAFTLLVGFIAGVYSSIFVASQIVLAFERRRAAPGRAQRAAS